MRVVILLALLLAHSPGTLAEVPASLDQAIARIDQDEPRNRVLNQLQAATLALDLGRLDEAGWLFDQALVGINAVYADSPQAAAARSLWLNEGAKDFKGEPYERAMAFYYRGLLDLFASDYENARASFKSGVLQDAFAEEAQHRADFALLIFLEAWASHLLGAEALASERFAELKALRPDFPLPAADQNVLVIAETGKAPRKLQDGVGGNRLVYRPGKRFEEQGVTALIGGQARRLEPLESIYWQASSRGGRPIDGILEGQVQFRQTTQSAAADVSGVSAELSRYSALFGGSGSGALAGVGAVAGLATLITHQIKARADNRFWNNLPDKVHLLTLRAPAQAQEVTFQFIDSDGRPLPELEQVRAIHFNEQGHGIVWLRARRATDVDK